MKNLKTYLTVLLMFFGIAVFSQDMQIEQEEVLNNTSLTTTLTQLDSSIVPFYGVAARGKYKSYNIRKKLSDQNLDDNMYLRGMSDAQKYYYKYRGTGTVTSAATVILSPMGGLVTAVLISGREPAPESWVVPNTDFLKDADYREGYAKQAKLKRARNAWRNWAITTAILGTGSAIFFSFY